MSVLLYWRKNLVVMTTTVGTEFELETLRNVRRRFRRRHAMDLIVVMVVSVTRKTRCRPAAAAAVTVASVASRRHGHHHPHCLWQHPTRNQEECW